MTQPHDVPTATARVLRRVCVVGGAGFIGRVLVAALRARGDDVVVADRVVGDASGVRIDLTARDATDQLARAFDSASCVVHLAARVDPANPAEREQMRRLHIDGTEAVVRAARAAGVSRIVLASSASVYGAWPDNPVPLEETRVPRPNPGFWYAEDKLAQERIVAQAGMAHAIARPAIVYGPGARNYLTEILRASPRLPSIDGLRPPMQMAHVDDVARAFITLIDAAAPEGGSIGVVNVAPDDWLAFERVSVLTRRPALRVPRALTFGFDALARVMPAHLRAPRTLLPYLMYPFVVDNARLKSLGWRPQHGSEQALATVF